MTHNVFRLLRRLDAMKLIRDQHETAWEDNGLLFAPFTGEVDTAAEHSGDKGDSRVSSVLDGTGARAANRFSNFLRTSIFPSNTAWLKLRTDKILMEETEVREALDVTDLRVLQAMSDSNFYPEGGQFLRNLPIFGNAGFMTKLDKPILNRDGSTFGGLVYESVPPWRYWIERGDAGRVIFACRQYDLPAIEVNRLFDVTGQKAISLMAQDDHFTKMRVFQFLMPNENAIPGGVRFDERQWVSIWVEPQFKEIIHMDGFDMNPLTSGVWEMSDHDPWGFGPGHQARPDAICNQEIMAQEYDALGRDMNPTLVTGAEDDIDMDLGINGHITARRPSINPEYLNTNSRYDVAEEIRRANEQSINRAFHVDALEDPTSQPRSAEESKRLRERVVLALGSASDSIANEFLGPVVGATVFLMERSGALPELTELSRRLGGVTIRPTFQSPFFAAQKRTILDNARDWVRGRVELASATGDPTWLDDIDKAAYGDLEAELMDLPARVRLTPDELAATQEARASQAAQERTFEVAERLQGVTNAP